MAAGKKAKHLINEHIRDKKVMIIDENNENLGVFETSKGIELARSKDLDLVLMVPFEKTGKVSICKIIDYGKYIYQQDIKAKQAKKNQVISKQKEIKVRPQVGNHDLEWKAKNAREWLENGDQVKFKITAYGRIRTKTELIEEIYQKFLALVGDVGKVMTPLKQLSPVLYEAIIVKK